MQRRSFLKKTGLSAAALGIFPGFSFTEQQKFSILELMGKIDIDLFGKEAKLREPAHNAFVQMKKAAYKDGIDLKVVSSYRSFAHQKRIWERKYIAYTDDGMEPLDAIDKIIEYSTIPGTSRHHWGTEVDVIDGYPEVSGDVLLPEKFETGGPFERMKAWMDKHANTYDYYIVYTANPKRNGFKYEPWHYSYAPLSIPMLTTFRKKNIGQILQNEDFLGVDQFTSGFLRTYIRDNILDINPTLL